MVKTAVFFPCTVFHQNQFQILLLELSFAERIWDFYSVNSSSLNFLFLTIVAKLFLPATLVVLCYRVLEKHGTGIQILMD